MQNEFRENINKLEGEINNVVKFLHSFLDSLNSYYLDNS